MPLILPGDPEFDFTLATALTPGWQQECDRAGQQLAFVVDSQTGLMKAATPIELDDYLCGGEYQERLIQIGLDPEEI